MVSSHLFTRPPMTNDEPSYPSHDKRDDGGGVASLFSASISGKVVTHETIPTLYAFYPGTYTNRKNASENCLSSCKVEKTETLEFQWNQGWVCPGESLHFLLALASATSPNKVVFGREKRGYKIK